MTQIENQFSMRPLSADELTTLRIIAGQMIPENADMNLPGADDDTIFHDLASSLERDTEKVRQAIMVLHEAHDGFVQSSPSVRLSMLTAFRAAYPALAAVFEMVIAQCYYRDDRVMRAIGMEPRPPFPLGFELAPGNFALLDPVRSRGRKYRDAS